MKRLMLVVFALSCFFYAKAQEAIYVYRNDGLFNAFYQNEVDSITTSKFDENGNESTDFQSQVVWTQDSVYYIPLAAIDSVSLCAPEKKYAPGVKMMDSLIPYITEVDGMSFRVSSNTPSILLPQKGDILLYENYDNELYPYGFAGRVKETGSLFVCDSIVLDDIYEQLICFGEYRIANDEDATGIECRRLVPRHIEVDIPESYSFDVSLAYKEFAKISIGGEIETTIRLTFKYIKDEPLYLDFSATSNAGFVVGTEVWGEPEGDLFSNTKFLKWFTTPIPSTPLFFSLSGKPSLKVSLKGSFGFSTGINTDFAIGYRLVNGQGSWYGSSVKTNVDLPTFQGTLSGSIFGGICLDPSIGCPGNILSVSPETTIGVEFNGEFVLDPLNTEITYNELKGCSVNLDAKAIMEGKAKFDLFKIKHLEVGVKVLELTRNINSWKLVPSFTTPQIEMTNLTKAVVSVVPEEKLLPPGIDIGLGVWNASGDIAKVSLCPEKYRDIHEWPLEKFQSIFEGLSPGTEYEVSPVIWWEEKMLKASPSAPFRTSIPQPAKISNFEVNNASFIREGFEYKNKTYYYDYAATTTVELESVVGVEDWGYVYKDPDGDTIHISVKELGTNADSRYNYFRAIPKSTATLYGYAKYGEDNYVYDDPKDYPLEYIFHPTAYVGEIIADSITTTSAQFEYGFDDVPRTGKCYVAYQAVDKDEPLIEQVPYTEKDTIKVTGLHPATTYDYWAYVEYAGETYVDLNGKKTFTTLTPSAYVEKADAEKITTTSAQVVYGFSNVPENSNCYITIRSKIDEVSETGEEMHSNYSQTYSVPGTEKGFYEFTGLKPSTTYSYFAYIEYEEDLWSSDIESFTTKTPPPPVATTGDCSNVTTTSATVSCTFENVPDDGVCGVVYKWGDGEFSKKTVNNANGTQTITLSGLKSGTTYTYNAYIEANGQTYYGGEKTFTTTVELPDLSGTWSCTIYNVDNTVLDTPTLTFTSDKKVTQTGSSFTSEDKVGSWSVDTDGAVGINFSWTGGSWSHPVYYGESFSGVVNSISNPSSIEGTVYRAWAGISEHGNTYRFVMSR